MLVINAVFCLLGFKGNRALLCFTFDYQGWLVPHPPTPSLMLHMSGLSFRKCSQQAMIEGGREGVRVGSKHPDLRDEVRGGTVRR